MLASTPAQRLSSCGVGQSRRRRTVAVSCAVLASTCFCGVASAQRVNNQKHTRSKPGAGVSGLRSVDLSSPRDGPPEMTWTGGWQQSPFPVCPLGTFASADLLSPDGCLPCPRGTYASSDNLGAVDECALCPAGTYNNRPGAQGEGGCARCPPHTWGAAPGLRTAQCSGQCPSGKYASRSGNTAASACQVCPPNFTGGGGQCPGRGAARKVPWSAQGGAQLERASSAEYLRLQREHEG